MLAKPNRITQGADYRGTVRRGKKYVGPSTVTYIRASDDSSSDARFGFIVAKSVGVAVVRNRVRRRLKAASYALLPSLAPGTDVVVRALPEAASQPYGVLFEELSRSLTKGSVLA
ncbi:MULTISPECIES: ribonuclease P protein component [Herbiconiux]|uniref:Ribonuclease P protein component n=1 Tax=Herbiconiux flava TaxID=881268 RepID=A0A852SIJ0_9MICO|nr:ribonuclease P protein component [Herbiconiux flava]NQX34827.1 ribonuclease P protein component [Herbiconiux sp. VKM Ac-2851]NYD69604.1 ribonuclease P protein component [Herbiconiux flava]GLK16351.1 ribonuclease P protein component [Herbiconiux flava]